MCVRCGEEPCVCAGQVGNLHVCKGENYEENEDRGKD